MNEAGLKSYDNTTRQKKSVAHLGNINIADNYGTPKDVLLDGCRWFNMYPKIDVAANDKLHVLPNYVTEKENLFTIQVKEDAFANFPYSKQEECMEWAWTIHEKYNINFLILAYNKTDTVWWHKWVESKRKQYGSARVDWHFIQGRIKFLDADGKPTKNVAPYPSVFIAYKHQNILRRLVNKVKDFRSSRATKQTKTTIKQISFTDNSGEGEIN